MASWLATVSWQGPRYRLLTRFTVSIANRGIGHWDFALDVDEFTG